MKYYKIILCSVILFLSMPITLAFAQCSAYQKTPTVQVNFNYGKVYYDNTKSSNQFPALPYNTTMGLTSAQLVNQVTATSFNIPQRNGTVCIGLDSITVNIGYPKIDAYIDKKYRPGSCNYKVIKAHENYHVRVQQEGLKFFSGKIKEAYQIAAKKVKVKAARPGNAQQILNQMVNQIKNEVEPLLSYVEKRMVEENLAIDTQSSYQKETAKCPKW